MNNLRIKHSKMQFETHKITVDSKMNYQNCYKVKLTVMNMGKSKQYVYEFEGEEQWNQYYYSHSYKAHPTSMSRTIKFTLLKAINQFLIK